MTVLQIIRVHPGPVLRIASLSGDSSRVVVGRADGDGELALDDGRVSRRHLEIRHSGRAGQIVDLSSKNGTWLDGRRIKPEVREAVGDGSVVRVGDTLLVVRYGPQRDDPEDGMHEYLPGRAPGVSEARALLRSLAEETGPVLILGETGTGKEYAARSLGAVSGGFVPVNCAELTSGLARAELFGSERGAFTDAANRAGLITLANGGVLFLDEIGDLDLGVQAELLRFIEDGTYRRVGGKELTRSTARLVAATNVDLDAAVTGGRFRRDLLGRLRRASQPVRLPPLRERREDVLTWAARFLAELHAGVDWSTGFAEQLLLHAWPENLRELSGVVRTAARSARGSQLRREHLAGLLRPAAAEEAAPAVGTSRAYSSATPDRQTIEAVLAETNGRVRAASQRLGIERTKLYRLLTSMGIELESFRKKRE